MNLSFPTPAASFVLLLLILASCSEEQPVDTVKEATVAYETKALLGEGPIWDEPNQLLYWVDIVGNELRSFHPATSQEISYPMPSSPGTVVPSTDTSAVVALRDGIYSFNIPSKSLELISGVLTDHPGFRLNDGKCDPQGRLWVGSMHFDQIEGAAKLYKIDSQGNVDTMINNVTISNGIVWSGSGTKMYYIDTPTGKVVQYDFNGKDGRISNPKTVIEIPKEVGAPDGMAIDSNDHLWIGLWNGGKVICIDPEQGKQVDEIIVPAHNVTACAFGGKDLKTLYITTSSLDMTDEEKAKYPLAGSLFKYQSDVKGTISTRFGLQDNDKQ